MPEMKLFSRSIKTLILIVLIQTLDGCQTYKNSLDESWSRIEKSIKNRNAYVSKNTDQIRKDILTKYKGQILTPQNVNEIDLSHLKPGFHYAMTNPLNNSKKRYTLIDTTGGLFKFREGITTPKGVEKESTTFDYLNTSGKTVRWKFGKFNDAKFTPPKSLFTLGETTYQIHDSATKKPGDKNIISVINVMFRDGIWEVTYNTPHEKNYKIEYIFDKNGLPLFEYDKQDVFAPIRIRESYETTVSY